MIFSSKLLFNIRNFNKKKLNKENRCLMNKCYKICFNKETFFCKKHLFKFQESIVNVDFDNGIDYSFYFDFDKNYDDEDILVSSSLFEIENEINKNNIQVQLHNKLIQEYKMILKKII